MGIMWNVKTPEVQDLYNHKKKTLKFYCVGYIDKKGDYNWQEAIRIDYNKRIPGFPERLQPKYKYELRIHGKFIGWYDFIEDAHDACYQIYANVSTHGWV
jgi:hypothetical protein